MCQNALLLGSFGTLDLIGHARSSPDHLLKAGVRARVAKVAAHAVRFFPKTLFKGQVVTPAAASFAALSLSLAQPSLCLPQYCITSGLFPLGQALAALSHRAHTVYRQFRL